jgi:hypothetical protein
MAEEVYLVREQSYEYNDEVYRASEDGYKPLVLYKSKDKAQQVAFEKNIQFLMRSDLEYYGYSIDEILNENLLIQLFPDTEDFLADAVYDVDWKGLGDFISNLSVEDQVNAIKCFHVKPFTVQSIIIEDD